MKKLITYLFIVFSATSSYSQIIENKLNLSFGLNIGFPLNHGTIHQDQLNYPSFFGNCPATVSPNIFLDYNIRRNFSLGVELNYTYYSRWNGDANMFILSNPSIRQESFALVGTYFLQDINVQFSQVKTGIVFGPALLLNSLNWTKINNQNIYNTSVVLPKSESKLHPGLRCGVCLQNAISNRLGFRLDFYYQYERANSIYYLDKSFNSLNLRVRVILRLFNDKYYNYE